MAYSKLDNSELRQLQLCELEILKRFSEICEKHDLRYFMIGGTMLGAIRHKGFIPWDDDVDIGMPRPDYIRFLQIAGSELPPHFQLLNYRKDKEYLRYFSRLVDKNVRIYNDSNSETLIENAWVDIFPLDGSSNQPIKRWLQFYSLCAVRVKYHFSCFEKMVNLMRPGRPFYQRAIIKFGQVFKIGRRQNTKGILNRIDQKLRSYQYDHSLYVMNFFGAYVKKELLPRKWFGEGVLYQFEDIQLRGPSEYDVYLTNFYGDYHAVPSDIDKDKHTITKIEYLEDNE